MKPFSQDIYLPTHNGMKIIFEARPYYLCQYQKPSWREMGFYLENDSTFLFFHT